MNTAVGVTSGRQGRGQGLLLPQRHGDCRAPAARHPPVPFCVCMCPYVCVCVVMCDLMCPCNNMGTIGHPLLVILRCPSVSLCVRMCDLICSRNSGLGLMSTYGASDKQAYMARQAGRHTHPRAHGYIKKKNRSTDGYHRTWEQFGQLWTDKIHKPGSKGRDASAVDHLQVLICVLDCVLMCSSVSLCVLMCPNVSLYVYI